MKNITAILGGIGVGAALMYLFDPQRGKRRRALIKDKAVGIGNDARQTLDKKSKDLKNRAQGLLHEAKARIASGAAKENQMIENQTM